MSQTSLRNNLAEPNPPARARDMRELTMTIVIFIIVAICVSIGVYLGYKSGIIAENTRFVEYWTNDCRQDGGIVQNTTWNAIECFKEGVIINHID